MIDNAIFERVLTETIIEEQDRDLAHLNLMVAFKEFTLEVMNHRHVPDRLRELARIMREGWLQDEQLRGELRARRPDGSDTFREASIQRTAELQRNREAIRNAERERIARLVADSGEGPQRYDPSEIPGLLREPGPTPGLERLRRASWEIFSSATYEGEPEPEPEWIDPPIQERVMFYDDTEYRPADSGGDVPRPDISDREGTAQ